MHSIRCLPDEKDVSFDEGVNLMAALVDRGVALTRACGGRARCSTCRVAVLEGLAACEERNEDEAAMALRLGFPDEVRLACQTGVRGSVAVRRLVLDADDVALTSQITAGSTPGVDSDSGSAAGSTGATPAQEEPVGVGTEQFVAVLFADIAGFTTLSDRLPAFDIVHLLNRYFAEAGRVIERHDGRISNYVGDGLLGLFDGTAPARSATSAGLELLSAAQDLDGYVQAAYGSSFSIRVGVHCGLAVVGAVGALGDRRETVIGDTVNVASRVEAANKELDTRLLVTCSVRSRIDPASASAEPDGAVDSEPEGFVFGRQCEVELRGKTGSFTLHEVVRRQDAEPN